MLQKYESANGTGNDDLPAFGGSDFDRQFREPEAPSAETIFGLPAAASAGDIREIVRFLSRANACVRISELPSAEPRRVFEPHKLAAYEAWGIVVRDEQYIRLAELGGALAKRNTFEKRIYRQILSNLPPYRSAVEWIGRENLKIVTFHDLADFWTDKFPALLLGKREMKEIEDAALSFFSICHAAELGIVTVGKRGQPTRLSAFADEAAKFLKNDYAPEIEISPAAVENDCAVKTKAENQIARVYISLGQRKRIESLVELLELTGLESLTARDVSLENNFFNRAQISLMQRCNFGLFILDETHCRPPKNGSLELRNEKIIEINTALALFSRQITILWDDRGNPPQNIRDARLRIFTKSDSEWETNLRIAKSLKEFPSESSRTVIFSEG